MKPELDTFSQLIEDMRKGVGEIPEWMDAQTFIDGKLAAMADRLELLVIRKTRHDEPQSVRSSLEHAFELMHRFCSPLPATYENQVEFAEWKAGAEKALSTPSKRIDMFKTAAEAQNHIRQDQCENPMFKCNKNPSCVACTLNWCYERTNNGN